MDMEKWLSALLVLLVLLPSGASCYYVMKNQMKYTLRKTAALFTAVLLPYAFFCSILSVLLRIDVNIILLPSLVLLFFPYRCTVTASLPKCLAVYVGVCAVHTFPAQFAYAFDAFLHPASGAADFSVEAAFSGFYFPVWLPPLSHSLPAGFFSGSSTVWTPQRYGTPPPYCPLSFCSSI